MSFLYPRLLIGQARSLHERYRELKIQELTELVEWSHDSAVFVATGGDRVTEQMLRDLREQVVGLAEQAGFPDDSSRDRRKFDLRLAKVLHSRMGIVPAEAASGDVWAFLALVLLPDVAYWRYPRPPGDRVLGTDLTRHVFGRMWWRAQLVHTPGNADPYASLDILGEAAFDQIYARRRALGGSPHLVKAILRVWDGLNRRGLDERQVLRNFLMRLLRLGPFVSFEALDEPSLDAELLVVLRETVEALLGADEVTDEEREERLREIFRETRFSPSDPRLVDGPREERPTALADSVSAGDPAAVERRGAAVRARDQLARRLLPYTSYDGPGFGDPREIGLQACAEALVTVVAVEGPVKAERAYRIITRLAGTRLSETTLMALVQATRYAVRKGMLRAEGQQARDGYPQSTLRSLDQPERVLRRRGPRESDEIPERELVAAASLVQQFEPTMDLDVLAKRTSTLFGYETISSDFKALLVEALKKHAR